MPISMSRTSRLDLPLWIGIGIFALVNVSLVARIVDGDHFWANHLAPPPDFSSSSPLVVLPRGFHPLPKQGFQGGIAYYENENENGNGNGNGNEAIQQPSQTSSISSKSKVVARSAAPAEGDVKKTTKNDNQHHHIAGLSCAKFSGPSNEIAAEMVYWRDIPSDSSFKSPLASSGESRNNKKYLTFEPDSSGFNNVRMAMETAAILAFATGRILVLPPKLNMYQLETNKNKSKTNSFSLENFFHFSSIQTEHLGGVEIMSMEDFLKREALAGNLRNKTTGLVSFPPDNQTNWDTTERSKYSPFWPWLRDVTKVSEFNMRKCIVGIPSTPGKAGADRMLDYFIVANATFSDDDNRIAKYMDHPTNVNAAPVERMPELLMNNKTISIYDEKLQDAKVFHIVQDNKFTVKMLIHFYAFVFFEDWHDDLWTKRSVRDHLRYRDEIQCAAARVVEAMRAKARENGNPNGDFDTFHVRRGDFEIFFKTSVMDASNIISSTADVLEENSTIFIATDERDKSFFDPFRERHNIHFLDDFLHLVSDINTTHYGMLDQRVASRGRTFIGTFHSTFTGYINRMRGYHSQKNKLQGYQQGVLNSYYYAPESHKHGMTHYSPIVGPVWAREFPLGKQHSMSFGSKICIFSSFTLCFC
jgi:hypothetical protein